MVTPPQIRVMDHLIDALLVSEEIDGKRYQANFLLVEIGSKPKKS
jgi:hypothetical protein